MQAKNYGNYLHAFVVLCCVSSECCCYLAVHYAFVLLLCFIVVVIYVVVVGGVFVVVVVVIIIMLDSLFPLLYFSYIFVALPSPPPLSFFPLIQTLSSTSVGCLSFYSRCVVLLSRHCASTWNAGRETFPGIRVFHYILIVLWSGWECSALFFHSIFFRMDFYSYCKLVSPVSGIFPMCCFSRQAKGTNATWKPTLKQIHLMPLTV